MNGMTPELVQSLTERLARVDALYRSVDAALGYEVEGFQSDVTGTHDLALIHALVKPADDFVRDHTADGLARAYLTRQVQRFTGPIRDLRLPGVSDLRTFVAHFNTGEGGPYRCLLSPAFATLYRLLTGLALRPEDILPLPGVSLGYATVNGAGRPAGSVDPAAFAGCASPVGVVSGAARVASRSAGADRLTVTGTARDRRGAVQEDRKFTALLLGTDTFVLDPAEEGDLLLRVEEITLPTNMTQGSVTVYSTAPCPI